MTTHIGRDGVVKLGANDIAEITAWRITRNTDTVEDHAMGDTWKTRKATFNDWSGEITCHWDPDDANGQAGLTPGATVTIDAYPDGEASGDWHYTGSAIVSQIVDQADMAGLVQATFTFVGSGALTEAAVA